MMAYFIFFIASVFHVLAMFFAAILGMHIKSDKDTAKAALFVSLALASCGILTSAIAGNLLFGGQQ